MGIRKQFSRVTGVGLFALLISCGEQQPISPPTAQEPDPVPLNYHAVVIGISDYAGTGWSKLITANGDAKAIGKILRDQYCFQVTELLDRQATRKNILQTLEQMLTLTENDALLIYYAGHGFYDEKMDEGYWIPYGANRSDNGIPAKNEWLWNSSISRLIEASTAKHVLVIADTCYGGSLFRGTSQHDKTDNWYRRAANTPSRYLITSGNMEPVLDSGIRHSIFAQEVLNYLEYSEQRIFSASDIGFAIRKKVSELTGQLVRMGPLTSAADAGGEFVFTRNTESLPRPTQSTTNAVPTEPSPRGQLDKISLQIKKYSENQPDFLRPRILACIGPTGSNEVEAAKIQKRIYKHLNEVSGCIIVEREDFDSLLHEIELSRSDITDQRLADLVGRMLPASLLILGEILPAKNYKELHLRVVDTESSRVLRSLFSTFSTEEELDTISRQLASEIIITLNQSRPLMLPATVTESGMIQSRWGRFHGARTGDSFDIVAIENKNMISEAEILLGKATIQRVKEESSFLTPEWTTSGNTIPTNLWLKTEL